MAAFPNLAQRAAQGSEPLAVGASCFFKLVVLSVIPVAIIANVAAQDFLIAVFGEGFGASEEVMRIAMWGVVGSAFNSFLIAVLQAAGRARAAAAATLTIVAVHCGFAFFLIPGMGPEGAAWAFTNSECIGIGVLVLVLRRRIDLAIVFDRAWRLLATAAISIAAGSLPLDHSLERAVACAIAFLLAAALLRPLGGTDLDLLRGTIAVRLEPPPGTLAPRGPE
jgi:O-antigen/teichoic acid export membrane protein